MRRTLTAMILGLVSVGCGSDSPSGPSSSPNGAPVFVSGTVTPGGQIIAGVTVAALVANATDPDGDALTYTWNLGDGRTVSGATASAMFPNAGTFNITVTISDGKTSTNSGGYSLVVKTLQGTWVGGVSGISSRLLIDHTGGVQIKGKSATDIQACGGRIEGLASSPRRVELDIFFAPGACNIGQERFVADLDATIDTMTGTYCVSGTCGTLSYKRQ